MSLSFAICDDSPDDRELLASLTRQWAAQTNTVVKLSEFTSAENYLFRAPEEGSPDILHREGAIPSSFWMFHALPEAPSNFVRLSSVCGKSVFGW